MINILYYAWNKLNDEMTIEAFKSHEENNVTVFERKITDYHADSAFGEALIRILHEKSIDVVFSYNYFPIISMICEINHIPYISWLYDCPLTTTFSKTITNECNYVFNFDRLSAQRLDFLGCAHSIHYPLSGSDFLIRSAENSSHCKEYDDYKSDITFVGGLYNGTKNAYRNAEFDEFTKGYLDGIISAQKKVYGYNFIYDSLNDDIVSKVVSDCKLELSDMYTFDAKRLASDVLGREVTARERIEALGILARIAPVDLYTQSELPDDLKKENIRLHSTVSYSGQMPLIFKKSRINLNITSKTIESGVPLRIFDILSCGGFCLTNYQPEVAELFEDGVDLVMYTSMKDMAVKAAYYLEHEKEREQIALNGQRRVLNDYNLSDCVSGMLDIVFPKDAATEASNKDADCSTDDLYAKIERMISERKIDEMSEFLYAMDKELVWNNDLSTLYFLIGIYKIEKKNGVIGIFDRGLKINEIVRRHDKLRRFVRKLEWWDEYTKDELIQFMLTEGVSAYELQWAVDTTAVYPEKIWRKLR